MHITIGNVQTSCLGRGWSFIRMVSTQSGLHQVGLSFGWSIFRVVLHQSGHSSRRSFIRVVLHQGGLSSWWSFIKAVFHQGGPLSKRSFIRVVPYQGGLSSEWSFIKAVLHHGGPYQGGLSSGWSFIRVVFHQGGPSSRWPLSSFFKKKLSGWSGWSFTRKVFRRDVLSSGWSLMKVVLSQSGFSSWWFFRQGGRSSGQRMTTLGKPRHTKLIIKKADFNSTTQNHTFSQSYGSPCPTVILLRTPCFTFKLDTGFFFHGVLRPQKP